MLRVVKLDRVCLSLPIKFDWFFVVRDGLKFISEEYGYKLTPGNNEHSGGLSVHMVCGLESMRVSVYRAYSYRWIQYEFTGEVDFAKFQQRLVVLGEYSLANAMAVGTTKRLELAVDVFGMHTSDVLCHCTGARSGHPVSNVAKTGWSIYMGSRLSSRQFVVYDKNQELADKGKPHAAGNLLRIELRLYRLPVPISKLIEVFEQVDPFDGLLVASTEVIESAGPKIKHWSMLIDACAKYGVCGALKCFPTQKKSLLNALKKSNMKIRPRGHDFVKMLLRLRAATIALMPVDENGALIEV